MILLRVILGLILLIPSLTLYFDLIESKKLDSEFTKVKAVVVRAQNRPNGDIQDFEVAFIANGEKQQKKYNSRTIVRNYTYTIGDTLNILYETNDNNNILIENSLGLEIRNSIIFSSVVLSTLIITFFWEKLKKVLL